MRGEFFYLAAHHGDRIAVGFEIRLAAIVKCRRQRVVFVDQGIQQLIGRAAFFGIQGQSEDFVVVGEVAQILKILPALFRHTDIVISENGVIPTERREVDECHIVR